MQGTRCRIIHGMQLVGCMHRRLAGQVQPVYGDQDCLGTGTCTWRHVRYVAGEESLEARSANEPWTRASDSERGGMGWAGAEWCGLVVTSIDIIIIVLLSTSVIMGWAVEHHAGDGRAS